MQNKILNDLFDYENLKIYQSKEGFKFSIDSILLAEYVKITKTTTNILDLCTGNAVVPLILSTKTSAKIDAFEIQQEIAKLAEESVQYNDLSSQIKIYNNDILDINNILPNKKYDIITCNPPYFKLANKEFINHLDSLAIARHEIKINLEDIFNISKSHLNTKGVLYLVHRATRLDELIILANKYKLNVKNIELIKTTSNSKPYLVLVKCIKDSKTGVKINDVKNIANLKTYQNLFKEEI